MGRKGVIYILVLLAGLLLSEHGAKGNMPMGPMTAGPPITAGPVTTTTTTALVFESTTTSGAVISSNDCSSYAEAARSLCSSVHGISDINTYLVSSDLSDVCSHSMLQYGCASLGNLPASTVTEIYKCVLTNNNTVTSQQSFSLVTSQINIDRLGVVLNSISHMVTSDSISDDNKRYMINSVWESLREDPNNLSPGVMSAWFQEKLYSFLPAMNMDILNCMNSLPMSCDALEAVVGALDVSYSKFDQDMKEQIGSWITRFIQAHSCMKASAAESILSYYKTFVSHVSVTDFRLAFTTTSMGSAIKAFTDFQLGQYVDAYDIFSSSESAFPVLELLDTKDYSFMFNFLSNLKEGNYGQDILYRLLYGLITKINAADAVCRPNIKTIFEGKLSYLFRAINSSILELIFLKDCSEFQVFYASIDGAYNDLSGEQKQLVFDYRLKFLNAEALKSEGSACSYGLSSLMWLQLNFGQSLSLLAYADMIRLNHDFNGYKAISIFSQNQTLDLVIQSNILTLESPVDYEQHVTSLVDFLKSNSFVYVLEFLRELRVSLIRLNIKFIVNINVRNLLLQGIWEIVATSFFQFTANDWSIWFNEYLYLLLPSITTQQLTAMTNTVVADCSNLQTIVGGFDNGFEYMTEGTKSDVGKWITDLLRNDTSRCLGDNWLEINFKHFKAFISYAVIIELNPDFNLAGSLTQLTALQIGAAVVTETTALSSVTFMETVFDVITNTSTPMENLGAFWDSFNANYEQVQQFTEEVKFKMLEWTTDEISVKFSTFTAEDYTLWFETRLYLVTVVINSTILAEFPLDADCGSYKAFVHALSINYEDTVSESKDDVFDFLSNFLVKGTKCTEASTTSYLESSFGNYSADATYEELTIYYASFNPYEPGVFEKLTDVQLGDMIVVANAYASQETVTEVFTYLQTLSVDRVDTCMAQFTATAKKKNIKIDITIGQTILKLYFNIIKTRLTTYTHDQIVQLFTVRMFVLIQFFTEETLNMFVIEDCDTLVVIVNQLDTGFASMSAETKSAIASWILGLLKSTKFNGCGNISQTSSVWVESVFKRFFAVLTIKEVIEVYPSLDIISVINNTSIDQKVEYLTSSQEILQDVNTTLIVLESLSGSDGSVSVSSMYTFLDEFKAVYEVLNVKSMTSEVREECMTFFFTNWISDLNSVTTVQIFQFETEFKYFLEGISIAAVETIPLTITCDVFEAIFSAFSSVSNQVSEDVAKFIFDTIIKFLQAKDDSSSDVCSTLYTDSKTYVQNIFFSFLKYATIYDIELYYSEVNMYKILTELTGQQLGNLFINSTAVRDQFEAIQILVELETREYSEVTSFMSEITTVAKEQNIATLPDLNIEKALYKTVWDSVSGHLETREDYSYWFEGNLDLIISSIPATAIQELPVSTDCDSQSYVVSAFGKVFAKLDNDQKESMHDQIKEFNTGVKNTKGQACETESGSSSEWVVTYYSSFIVLATLQELKEANSNFSAAEALSVISGVQVADYAIETKALWREETTIAVFESLNSTKRVEDFLTRINEVAPDDLKSSPVVEIIVSKTFEIISEDFFSFTQEDWTEWTQVTLTNILFAVDTTEVESFPLPLPCASYQEIVTGFNKVFDDMEEDKQEMVYNKCMKRQLSETSAQGGVRCGMPSWRSEEWIAINIGKFSIFANLTDLSAWNINLQITEIINTLSPDQLGEVAVVTIEKEEVACQVAGKVQKFTAEDTYSFLDSFVASFQQTGKTKITSHTIGYKFLSATVTSISSAFSGYSTSDWETLFSGRLQLFLFSINDELLTTILASANCDGYAVCVNSLSSVFDDLTDAESLFFVFKRFLNKQLLTTGGACPVDGEDSSASVNRLFGKFVKFVASDDFLTYIPTFDGLSAIALLSPDQMANLAFTGDLLIDATKAQVLVNSISSMTFIQLDSFLSSFQAIVQRRSLVSLPNAEIQASLFGAMYKIFSMKFLQLSNEQWANYWNFKLNIFLTSITVSQVQLIPESINCNAFQSVISGCSNKYNGLSEPVQNAIYQKAKSYLTAKTAASGPGCPVSSGGSGGWLNANFGLFSEIASVAEIKVLFPGFTFTDAIPYLTAAQLGSYVADLEVLSDKDKIHKVMGGITSVTIGEFMDSFNKGATTAGITQITNVAVKKYFLGEVFCKLGSIFSSFTARNYFEWFQGRLTLLISSMDAKAFGFIPTDISCDSLGAIMAALNTVTHPENPEDIYSFSKSVLEVQLKSTGDACTSGLNSKSWLEKFFGLVISSGTWTEFTIFYPHLQVTEVVSLLTATQLASASSTSSVVSNSTSITTLLLSFSGSLEEFLSYMETLRNSALLDPTLLSNIKVRDTVMMFIAEIVFPELVNFDLQTTEKWLTTIDFLLAGLNSTMLEQIPKDISCNQYRAIVSAVDRVFISLTNPKRVDFAAFQKIYLSHQFTVNGDACTTGTTNTVTYIQKNIALFCEFLTPDQVKLFYPDVNEVSYTQYCNLI